MSPQATEHLAITVTHLRQGIKRYLQDIANIFCVLTRVICDDSASGHRWRSTLRDIGFGSRGSSCLGKRVNRIVKLRLPQVIVRLAPVTFQYPKSSVLVTTSPRRTPSKAVCHGSKPKCAFIARSKIIGADVFLKGIFSASISEAARLRLPLKSSTLQLPRSLAPVLYAGRYFLLSTARFSRIFQRPGRNRASNVNPPKSVLD